MKPISRKFVFNTNPHPADVSESSQALEVCYNYEWSLVPIVSGLTSADGTYTIQVSNDGVTWFDWRSNSINIELDNAYCDTHMTFKFMKVVYSANTETTGTVEFEVTFKGN